MAPKASTSVNVDVVLPPGDGGGDGPGDGGDGGGGGGGGGDGGDGGDGDGGPKLIRVVVQPLEQ